MPDIPACPVCGMENTYPDGDNFICADCAHEWPMKGSAAGADDGAVVRDSNGNVLSAGDSVVVIKDLKVKGSGGVTLKRGTLVKNIRLTGDPDEIEANVEKVRGLVLRTEFVKKA